MPRVSRVLAVAWDGKASTADTRGRPDGWTEASLPVR
jgi:hypothetical protein